MAQAKKKKVPMRSKRAGRKTLKRITENVRILRSFKSLLS